MRLYRVILPVGDVEAAAAFYEALLGIKGALVSRNRYYLDAGGVIVALVNPVEGGRVAELRPNQEHVYFSTDRLAEARERAITLDAATPPSAIETQPWGETSFYLADPWGNPLCVVQAGTEFTGGWAG